MTAWALVLALAVAGASTVPLQVFVIAPGSAVPVAARVSFPDHREDEPTGELLLTTVALSQATAADVLRAWLDDDVDVVDRDRVLPPDVDARRYFDAQREVFHEAGQLAAAVGLRAAGLPARISGDGAQVIAVLPDAPAARVLQPDDVVTAVAGSPVRLADDLVEALAGRPADTESS